jgi:hypothetical protein
MNAETEDLLELGDDDKELIRMVFYERIVPKLDKLHARLGTLNCDFAGKQFKNWNIYFRSKGSGYDVVSFEYDEDGTGIDLDL